jgi:hypothetical protein
VALAYLLRNSATSLKAAPAWALAAGAAALGAASLHDKFTVLGPHSNGQFVALELLAAAVLAASLAAVVGAASKRDPAGVSRRDQSMA